MSHGPGVFDDLLKRSEGLEERAKRVQGERELAVSEEEINALVADYGQWLAEGIAALPDETLVERFRHEFQGSWHSQKIKHFFDSPGAPQPLFSEDENPLGVSPWGHPFEQCFRAPMLEQRRILIEARQAMSQVPADLELIERICRGLPEFLVPLQNRREGRVPLEIDDEYDLQDVLHGLLRVFFEDVRPEDYAPERAGARSRIDFVLKPEKVVIETKITRPGRGAREIGNELITDIERYRSHPECESLVALVYDPDREIINRRTLESDLSGRRDDLNVMVIVVH